VEKNMSNVHQDKKRGLEVWPKWYNTCPAIVSPTITKKPKPKKTKQLPPQKKKKPPPCKGK
jgi:hypothetical protein